MTELIKLMRLFGEPGFIGTALQRQEIAKGAEDVERLRAALRDANARERSAFMAGHFEGGQFGSDGDKEQAWQQYRCQDDTDLAALSPTQEVDDE